ncbi:MAG: hypothetical protein Q9227_006282 [Pyrenula ochraceoflavens]
MLFFTTLATAALLLLSLGICAEDYYKLLGLDKSASERDIKRAYRTLSKKYHPDKNPGDESAQKKFVELAEAYDALSDSTLRKIYDQYGHEGVQQHRQGGGRAQQAHDPFDLFSRFFGGGGHFGHGGGQRRGPDMELRMAVPLRDFYTGRDVEFEIERQEICDACGGSGSEDGTVETCGTCSGRGMVVQRHQLAPGMFQQVQMQCPTCNGKGKSIKHICPVCGGHRTVKKKASMLASIEKGMPVGHQIIFENEADESPDFVAGDLVVTLVEAAPDMGRDEHERTDGTFFRRKDQDLFWKEVLSLREAWMGGWSRNITHLDGHVIQLSRKRGEVIQPMSVESVAAEGMPIWHEGHLHEQHEGDEFGRLNVEYTVILPDQLEKGMEKEFWALFEKWRAKNGVDLQKDSGRPLVPLKGHDEL